LEQSTEEWDEQSGRLFGEQSGRFSGIQEERRQRCRRALEHTLSSICSGAEVPDHNSAGEWAAHRLPGGQQQPKEEIRSQEPKAKSQRGGRQQEQRRERLPGQRLEQRMTQVEVKVEVEVGTHVEVQVKVERTTHAPMQANTRLRVLPQVLPDVQRGALRETQRRLRGEFAGCR